MTCRQFYSDTSTMLKSSTYDGWISPKWVVSEARAIVGDFIKKDSDAKRKLQMTSEGWGNIPCLPLEEVPVIQCPNIDVRICDKMMRSKEPLPETYSNTFGNIIKSVSSVNFSSFYTPTIPSKWNSIQKRRDVDKNKNYYFFIDGYIYIPIKKGNTQGIEEISIEAYFIDKYEVYLFNQKFTECKTCKIDCKSPLDFQLVCPSYLVNDVKKELLNKLAGIYKKINSDEYPNLERNDLTNQRDLQNSANGLS